MQQKMENALIVKVFYKKAMYNLGKYIKNHADLITQVKNRFPELQSFGITFKQIVVTSQNFEEILTSQIKQDLTSIKLEINELSVEKIVQQKFQKSKKFSFNSESQTKKFSFDPNEFEDAKDLGKKVQEPKKSESEFEQLKIQELNDIDLSQIKIKVLMGDSIFSLKKEVGEEYKWSCNFINQASTDVPEGVYIRQMATKKLISLSGMGAKEAEQIEFGPYVQKQMGKFTRFYQIIYKKKNDTKAPMIPIGNKFGFSCEAIKKLDVKELSSKTYKKINELKNFSACERSNEYIMAKFKEMGIEDSTIDRYEKEDLIDMMESFNLNE